MREQCRGPEASMNSNELYWLAGLLEGLGRAGFIWGE